MCKYLSTQIYYAVDNFTVNSRNAIFVILKCFSLSTSEIRVLLNEIKILNHCLFI